MNTSSGWIGEGNFLHNKEKPQEYRRIPRTFDAFVGKISRQAAAEPLGGMCSSLT